MKSTTAAKISLAAIAAIGSITSFVQDAKAAVVINEIYGGGGFTASTSGQPASIYRNDFIELFNNGTSAVDVSGYQIRYGSAASTSMSPTLPGSLGSDIPAGTIIPAGGSFLLAGAGAAATTTGAGLDLPSYDLLNTSVNISTVSGRVGLFDASSSVVDFVGFGTATAFEGAAAPSFTAGGAAGAGIVSLNRLAGVDTNNNSVDFAVASIASPTPSSSAVPEPASLGLAAAAGALLVGRRRR